MFLVVNSANKKIGNIAATYLPIEKTCPKTCPLYQSKACYAMGGNVGLQVIRLEKLSKGQSAYDIVRKEAREISAFGPKANGKALRLHVSGDVRSPKAAYLLGVAAKKWDGKVYSYTHSWRNIPRSVWGESISILASCESIEDAKQALERGYAPSIVVDTHKTDKAYFQDGIKVIPCPSQTRDVTCEQCKLCMKDNVLKEQNAAIAFAVHGSRKKVALTVIK